MDRYFRWEEDPGGFSYGRVGGTECTVDEVVVGFTRGSFGRPYTDLLGGDD